MKTFWQVWHTHHALFMCVYVCLCVSVCVCGERCRSYLDTTRGRINIFNILISSSPGNWKYFTSCKRSKNMFILYNMKSFHLLRRPLLFLSVVTSVVHCADWVFSLHWPDMNYYNEILLIVWHNVARAQCIFTWLDFLIGRKLLMHGLELHRNQSFICRIFLDKAYSNNVDWIDDEKKKIQLKKKLPDQTHIQ